MKQLIKIAATDSLQSLLPILMWYVVGTAYGDTDYFNIFTLTYAYQFIYCIIYYNLVIGTIQYERKKNLDNTDYSHSAILLSALIYLIINLCIFYNIDNIFIQLNVNSKYTNMYIFSIICLNMDMIVCGICKTLQYKEDNKKAFILTTIYYIIRILLVVISRLVFDNQLYSLILNTILLALVVLIICIKHIKIKKIRINIFKGVKYQISTLPNNIGMLVIYLFGLTDINGTVHFLASYNIMAMCTDTQWDILYSAIDTKTSLEICNGNYEKKKKQMLKQAITYSILLMISSIIMIIIMRLTKPFNIKTTVVLFIIECITFPLYAIRYTYESWLRLEYSGIWITIISTAVYIIRITLSFSLQTNYALSISVFIAAILGGISMIILYNTVRKKSMKYK